MENLVSVILPYWQRQRAAEEGLRSIEQHEAKVQMEIILVDDGDPVPFVPPQTTLDLTVLRLPKKDAAKSACVPINRGVACSRGDVIVLSCPEMLHTRPIFYSMLMRLNELGPRGYVSAAVFAPESNAWHVHSSLTLPPLNFCTMLRRSLWENVGGFDEEYREGYAFEDADFVQRLIRAGAEFDILDEAIIHHPRSGAKARYTREQHERNRLLYESKWGK